MVMLIQAYLQGYPLVDIPGISVVVGVRGGPEDFSNEYRDCRVRVETSIGVVVEGVLIGSSRYWFKVKTGKGVVYVNKAHVVTVTPISGQLAQVERGSSIIKS
jgi:hypothetical protein